MRKTQSNKNLIGSKNKMKKTKIFYVLAAIALIAVAVFATYPTPTRVFHKAAQSVVELKAFSADVGESYGSGVVISDTGLIVTNAHVITYSQNGESNTFDELYIRFASEEDYRIARLVHYDEVQDIAILQIDTTGLKLKPIKLADSDNLNFGETVYAVGNSSNFGISITKGIVSIPKVNIDYNGNIRSTIQCDLTISTGNSGGALLDRYGRLVGITAFRTKDNSGNVVYGFAYAIPVNIVIGYVESCNIPSDFG